MTEANGMSLVGPTLPTWALQQVGSFPRYTMLICADGVKQSCSQIMLRGVSFDPNKIVSFHN